MTGRIIKGIGGFYYVLDNEIVYECKARGIFRNEKVTPLPGDMVVFSYGGKIGSIEKILPRSNELSRPAISNVNLVVVTIAASSPQPDLMLLDKLLIAAGIQEINAVVCINKIDLDNTESYKDIEKAYLLAGYTVLPVSAKTGQGMAEFKEALKGKISVFSGQSGVGKSTLINHLMASKIMLTGAISVRLNRGKHTTRHSELIPLEGKGFFADTPGFSSFELSSMDPRSLQFNFPEFEALKHNCRFKGCAHVNEPDCEVKTAAAEGRVDSGRYLRYVELYNTVSEVYSSRYKK